MTVGRTMGARLRAARAIRELSIEAVAEQLNVSKTSVSDWELDKKAPRLPQLVKLKELFDLDLDTLICGEDEAPRSRPPAAAAPPVASPASTWAHRVEFAHSVREPGPPESGLRVKSDLEQLVDLLPGLSDGQLRMLAAHAKFFADENARHEDELEEARFEYDPMDDIEPDRDD